MKVEIETSSGFCFGVENAVKIAEESLAAGDKVYSLGDIVHNETEVDRLKKLGLVTIDHEHFLQMSDCKVLIRAHGEPPSTYETARRNNITIIEATCPIVHTLQQRIKRVTQVVREEKGQIVIFGKEGHAEVVGLQGAADGKAIIVTSEKDLRKIDFTRPIYLFSQTTMSKKEYNSLIDKIRKKEKKTFGSHEDTSLKVHNTICGQVSGREPRLRTFAREHDVIIFVSGRTSSNGRMLYEVCHKENARTHMITSISEIDKRWFEDAQNVGICGATSTPRWLIHEVAAVTEKM